MGRRPDLREPALGGLEPCRCGRLALRTEHARQRPPDARREVELGGLRERLGETALAIAHYQRAVELDPLHRYAGRLLMRALIEAGRTDEAAEAGRRLLAQDPRAIDLLEASRALRRAGANDEERSVLERLRSRPDAEPLRPMVEQRLAATRRALRAG